MKPKGTFKVPDIEFKVSIYIFFNSKLLTDGGSEKVGIVYFFGVTIPSKEDEVREARDNGYDFNRAKVGQDDLIEC